MVDGTPVCSGQGASCSISNTLAIGSHTLTATAYVTDNQGMLVPVGNGPPIAIAVVSGSGQYKLGDLIVKMKDGSIQPVSNSLVNKYQIYLAPQLYPASAAGTPGDGQVYILKAAAYNDLIQAAKDFAADPNVEYAEPNLLYSLPGITPNDHYWNASGDMTVPPFDVYPDMWYLSKLRWDEAAVVLPGLAQGMSIADLDTGASSCHPDVAANLDLVHGTDVTAPPLPETGPIDPSVYSTEDVDGHGTRVSGILSAITNNTIGVVGMSRAKVIPVKIFPDRLCSGPNTNKTCLSSIEFIGRGIDYVTRNNLARVILIEAGAEHGNDGNPFSKDLERKISLASQKGIVVIQPAGNGNSDVYNNSPMNMVGPDKPIVVCAVDPVDKKMSFSNFGNTVDVCGFGTQVFTTSPPTFHITMLWKIPLMRALAGHLRLGPRLLLPRHFYSQTILHLSQWMFAI